MDFITNTWFVGIIGGIISGILVFFITNFIANRLYKKDYYKTVSDVNFKISRMLIMSIAEGKIPNSKVVGAILNSLARRNDVRKQDVNSIEDTYDDLVNELFETNFIPIDKKQTLASELINIKEKYLNEKQAENAPAVHHEYAKGKSMNKRIYIILSLTVVVTVLYMTLIIYYLTEKDILVETTEPFKLIFISLISFSFIIAALTAKSLQMRRERMKKELEKFRSFFDKTT